MNDKITLHSDGTAEFSDSKEAQGFLLSVTEDAKMLITELIDTAGLKRGDILVVGCSSSEVTGNRIGKASIPSVAEAIWTASCPY